MSDLCHPLLHLHLTPSLLGTEYKTPYLPRQTDMDQGCFCCPHTLADSLTDSNGVDELMWGSLFIGIFIFLCFNTLFVPSFKNNFPLTALVLYYPLLYTILFSANTTNL